MKTLIIIDMQRDFMPGNALGVPQADELIPIINELIPQFEHVLATFDWHPENHVSFSEWPMHCVKHKEGAKFAIGLHTEKIEAIFRKGIDPKIESYSAFFDDTKKRSTGLEDYLRKHNLHELYFVGVATDYCILYSALDAVALGFNVTVIPEACRAIRDGEKALEAMRSKGVKLR